MDNQFKMQIKIYLLLVWDICFFLGILAWFASTSATSIVYQILQKGFTAFPVKCAIIMLIKFPTAKMVRGV